MRKRKWDNNTLNIIKYTDCTLSQWIENKETFKKIQKTPHSMVIGLACLVMGGRGDLVFLSIIFNMLKKRYRDFDIRLLLEIDEDSPKRAHEVKNILIEEKIIKKEDYPGDTTEQIYKSIQNSNRHIQIVDHKSDILDDDILFWIHASSPILTSRFNPKTPYIIISEISDVTESDPNSHCLGVPNLESPSIQTCGFFIEDKMNRIQNLSKQSLALAKIRDPLFNFIIHAGIRPSIEGCEKLIRTTIFAHGYFASGLEKYGHLLKAFCISEYVLKSQKNVFISMNSIIDTYFIKFLNDHKFDVTLHVLDDQGQYQCTPHEVKDSIKKFNFLCQHFFSKEDLENLNDAENVCFPTGDFTLQDSMSRGSLPIFGVPSHKMDFPFNFVNYIKTIFPDLNLFFDFFRILGLMAKLENEEEEKEPDLTQLYHQNLVQFSQHYQDHSVRLIIIAAQLINKNLLVQWQVICQYLIDHHNAFYKVPDIIEKVIKRCNQSSSSISTADSKDCFLNHLRNSLLQVKNWNNPQLQM